MLKNPLSSTPPSKGGWGDEEREVKKQINKELACKMIEPNFNNYNKDFKQYARNLRNNSTLAEVILWSKVLRKRQLCGYSFLRQRPIGYYIVDFFSKDLNLIVELDGEIHRFQKKKDKKREDNLKELGYSIIRFGNEDVLNNLYFVERTLEDFVNEFEEKNGKIEPRKPRLLKRVERTENIVKESDIHPSNSPLGEN